ncbi:MAG: hypothetical protein ACK4PN_07905 [Allorhizobium sp.]
MEERAWIAETTRGAEASDFDGEGRIRFDDGPFAGFMERVPVRPGIALYRGLTDFLRVANICKS